MIKKYNCQDCGERLAKSRMTFYMGQYTCLSCMQYSEPPTKAPIIKCPRCGDPTVNRYWCKECLHIREHGLGEGEYVSRGEVSHIPPDPCNPQSSTNKNLTKGRK